LNLKCLKNIIQILSNVSGQKAIRSDIVKSRVDGILNHESKEGQRKQWRD
jgi:hypothetical protein